uniref:Uncharacterized protein n=1 Tax=Vespula pensylvanica TaxID=30213 RepID=A0A834UCI2_VESPE|nr:hypothetical protein H0235_004419 [Vespula pensylvanica]
MGPPNLHEQIALRIDTEDFVAPFESAIAIRPLLELLPQDTNSMHILTTFNWEEDTQGRDAEGFVHCSSLSVEYHSTYRVPRTA